MANSRRPRNNFGKEPRVVFPFPVYCIWRTIFVVGVLLGEVMMSYLLFNRDLF